MRVAPHEYEGHTQYKGMGVVKYCLICGCHRSQLGGFMKAIAGGRHWVCIAHKKAANA